MNPSLQIKAIAELDGWTIETEASGYQWIHRKDSNGKLETNDFRCLSYLTSRDAIVPVIEKQPAGVKDKIRKYLWSIWYHEQCSDVTPYSEFEVWLLTATATQLSEALLRATGKWVE